MGIEFYVTKMKNIGDKMTPKHCYKRGYCFPRYSATHKIIKGLNEFATKLHDMSSKVKNIYVCLNKVVLDAIEERMASNGHLSVDALVRSMD